MSRAARLEHLAHDHGVDVVGGDARLLECAADRDGAELDRRLAREVAVDAGERGACAGDDDDVGDAHYQDSFVRVASVAALSLLYLPET
jgi:hypothetical protein